MGEGLREVAEMLAGGGIRFFAVQAERAAERDEFVERRCCLVVASGARTVAVTMVGRVFLGNDKVGAIAALALAQVE